MDIDKAKNIMEALAWMEHPTQMLSDCIGTLDVDDQERLAPHYHRFLREHLSIMLKVLKQFPELDPDEQGEDWYFDLKKKYQTEAYPARKLSAEDARSAIDAGKAAAARYRENK